MELNERLILSRERVGLTLKDAAEKVGWSSSRLKNYETGYRTPTIQDVVAWNQAIFNGDDGNLYFVLSGNSIEDYSRKHHGSLKSSLSINESIDIAINVIEDLCQIDHISITNPDAISVFTKLFTKRCTDKLK